MEHVSGQKKTEAGSELECPHFSESRCGVQIEPIGSQDDHADGEACAENDDLNKRKQDDAVRGHGAQSKAAHKPNLEGTDKEDGAAEKEGEADEKQNDPGNRPGIGGLISIWRVKEQGGQEKQ